MESTNQIISRFTLKDAGQGFGLRMNSLAGCETRPFVHLKDIPLKHSGWIPLVAAAKFCGNPNHETLASALRALSGTEEWRNKGWLVSAFKDAGVPWPLIACLDGLLGDGELASLVDRAGKGDLGKFQHWMRAEERWLNSGVKTKDLHSMTDERWPYDRGIEKDGFPFQAAILMESPVTDLNDLVAVYRDLRGSRVGSWIGTQMVNYFEPNGQLQISRGELMDLIDNIDIPDSSFDIDLLLAVNYPDQLDEEWLEFFTHLGSRISRVQEQVYVHTQRERAVTRQIEEGFLARPNQRQGLLNVLRMLSEAGSTSKLPREMLQPAMYSDPALQRSVASLRLFQGDWSGEEANQIASCLRNSIYTMINLMESDVNIERIGEFALKYKDMSTDPLSFYNRHLSIVHSILRRVLMARRSPLGDPSIRAKLALPSLA